MLMNDVRPGMIFQADPRGWNGPMVDHGRQNCSVPGTKAVKLLSGAHM